MRSLMEIIPRRLYRHPPDRHPPASSIQSYLLLSIMTIPLPPMTMNQPHLRVIYLQIQALTLTLVSMVYHLQIHLVDQIQTVTMSMVMVVIAMTYNQIMMVHVTENKTMVRL